MQIFPRLRTLGRQALLISCVLTLVLTSLAIIGQRQQVGALSGSARLRVMALGDSITQGAVERTSWRYPFQQWVRATNCAIDMVGPDTILRAGASAGALQPDLDHDHGARGGRTSAEVFDAAGRWLDTFRPEVVILNVGANDLTHDIALDTTVDNIDAIITRARAANRSVSVLLTAIPAPARRLQVEAARLGERIEALAERRSTNDSPIVAVDAATGWDIDELTVDTDVTHPNTAGELHLARRYAAAFDELDRCGEPSAPTDRIGPGQVQSLTANRVASTTTIRWTPPTGNRDVARYVVRRNGVAIASTTRTSFVHANDPGPRATAYSVIAVDRSGNASSVRVAWATSPTPAAPAQPAEPAQPAQPAAPAAPAQPGEPNTAAPALPPAAPAAGFEVTPGGSRCSIALVANRLVVTWSGNRADVWRNGVEIGATAGNSWVDPLPDAPVTHFSVELPNSPNPNGERSYCGKVTRG